MVKNKILIITTGGCEGCYIAKNNVNKAINQSSQSIELEVKDWTDINKKFIARQRITDYPVVLYLVDDKVVHKAVGSYPSVVYLRWIDIYFKKQNS